VDLSGLDIAQEIVLYTADIPRFWTARTSREESRYVHPGHCADLGEADIAQDFAALSTIAQCLRLKCRVTARNVIIERLLESIPHDTEELALRLAACRPFVRPDDLFESQLASGAWASSSVAQPGNCFHTALALMALRANPHDHRTNPVAARAFAWLESMRGVEGHWLWKWKFRYFDQQVRFDTTKSGWPWVEGTVSWVAPTSMVILAYDAWRRSSPRLATAAAMLADRACPKGGWNAGNSEVFGVPLEPHPDFTAMALLGLRGVRQRDELIIKTSLDYLHDRLVTSESIYSLAWAALAMNVWNHLQAGAITQRLEDCVIAGDIRTFSVRTLSLAALALETPPFAFFGGRP
jgi:hypothetical protein